MCRHVVLRNSMQGFGDYKTPVFSSFIELMGKVVFTFNLSDSLDIGELYGQNQ